MRDIERQTENVVDTERDREIAFNYSAKNGGAIPAGVPERVERPSPGLEDWGI